MTPLWHIQKEKSCQTNNNQKTLISGVVYRALTVNTCGTTVEMLTGYVNLLLFQMPGMMYTGQPVMGAPMMV